MKKLIFLVCVGVLITQSLYTYSQEVTTVKEKRWSVSLAFSPDRYFSKERMYLYNDGYSDGGVSYLVSPTNFNYSIGAVLNYKINKRVVVGTSFIHSNKDMDGWFICPYCNFFAPLKPERIQMRFVGYSLFTQIHVIAKNPALYISGGFANEFTIMPVESIDYIKEYNESYPIVNRIVMYDPYGGIGFNYVFGKRKRMVIGSEFYYKKYYSNLPSTKYQQAFTDRLYQLGLNTSLGYKL